MANPTPSAETAIYNYVTAHISGGFSNTNISILGSLNNPSYTGNPLPQGTVTQTFSSSLLSGKLSSASLRNLAALPDFFGTVVPAFDSVNKNVSQLNSYLSVWTNAGYISQSERNILNNYINVVIADNNYQNKISWSQAFLGRPCDLSDLNATRQFYLSGSGVTN